MTGLRKEGIILIGSGRHVEVPDLAKLAERASLGSKITNIETISVMAISFRSHRSSEYQQFPGSRIRIGVGSLSIFLTPGAF